MGKFQEKFELLWTKLVKSHFLTDTIFLNMIELHAKIYGITYEYVCSLPETLTPEDLEDMVTTFSYHNMNLLCGGIQLHEMMHDAVATDRLLTHVPQISQLDNTIYSFSTDFVRVVNDYDLDNA